MKDIVFMDEKVTEDDLFFLCYMIERIGRRILQKSQYIINKIPYDELIRLISLSDVLHCENPEKLETEWINEYHLEQGDFDRANIDKSLVENIPSSTQMGKVYKRLVISTLQPDENYVDGMIRVYNDEICDSLDNYNTGAYYEPSYFIARAYNNGGF